MRLDLRIATATALACCLCVSLVGCGSGGGTPAGPVASASSGGLRTPASTPTRKEPSAFSLNELRSAPERLVVGGREYGLQAQLSRDFMPVSPPDGKPLVVLVQVIEQNGQPIAPDLKLEYLWVINGSEIWATTFSPEALPSPPQGELDAIARDGPKWGPQIQVQVVVGLRRGDGFLELLGAADQWIVRTD